VGEGEKMVEPERVTAEEIHQRLKSEAALLVCAYEDDAKFKKLRLQGAISLNEFKSRLSSLTKDQEIVFYCA
jgi:rhodanese-related sulfurtransferase